MPETVTDENSEKVFLPKPIKEDVVRSSQETDGISLKPYKDGENKPDDVTS